MNRQEKAHVIQDLKTRFSENQASFFVGVKGLTVSQISQLRRELHTKGGNLHVAKITLLRRAIQDIPVSASMMPLLKDQLALVFAHEDSLGVAKIICDFSKKNQQLIVVGGVLETAHLLNKESVVALASLPAKEVLIAQLCGLLNAPIAQLGRALSGVMVQLAGALKEVERKKADAA